MYQPLADKVRPKTFKEYVGQERVKDILDDYIIGTRIRDTVFPHTLIHGQAGMGKTTLAKIIANSLKVKFVETITSDISDFNEMKKYIERCEGGILFLDEIHSISRDNAEKLYSIMEDFKYRGENIQPFTLMAATTELGEIIKTKKPFYDRFKLILELENYNLNDLYILLNQYRRRMFKKDNMDNKIYKIISENCRGTPRTGIRLLEATIYANNNIGKILKNYNIIKYGYTKRDLKLLEYMKINECPVGLQSISSYLGIAQYNYLYEIEPYLLSNGVISRTSRGRRITSIGEKLIQELREIQYE